MDTFHTTPEVIDALGGNVAVAQLVSSNRKAVWNWRKSGAFPARTYLAMISALHLQQKTAPPSLWGMS